MDTDNFGGRSVRGRGAGRDFGGGRGAAVERAPNQWRTHRPAAPPDGFGGLAPGRAVRHDKFGEGMVIALEGQGEHARVQVNFAAAGTKWLVCHYARLQLTGDG